MATAIIGLGNIGKPLAQQLAAGGEQLIVAARGRAQAEELAGQLGGPTRAAGVKEAIEAADTVIFAVWLDVLKSLIAEHADLLDGKVVVDPSNPIAANEAGEFVRTLPDGISGGSVVAGLLPDGAHYVKAFGSLPAQALAEAAGRTPLRAALFYATDDDIAQQSIEKLIQAAGFDPVKAGGVDAALRIEVFGDLHPSGGLDGHVPNADEARAARGPE